MEENINEEERLNEIAELVEETRKEIEEANRIKYEDWIRPCTI